MGKEIIKRLYKDQKIIVHGAIRECLPEGAVEKALLEMPEIKGKVIVVSIGKAAYRMAEAAAEKLKRFSPRGIVVTKYGHAGDGIENFEIIEAGHPIPDKNSVAGAKRAVEMVRNLSHEDLVVFLVSGGGSSIFEIPLIPLSELEEITSELLSSGAGIKEINTVRKRLSKVKGGKFAKLCEPARIYSVVLSDILGDPLDMIASGPAVPDSSYSSEALKITEKYGISLSEETLELLNKETPKTLTNVTTVITGSVRKLAEAAKRASENLGYETHIITSMMSCEAKEAGSLIASVAATHKDENKDQAFIFGGETVVKITGNGKGGRNQELALSAAEGISGIDNAVIFSFGSDGTDGPTDAAGGIVDGTSFEKMKEAGINPYETLRNNDSYSALEKIGGLIKTGPTGTNVNDLSVVLIRGKNKERHTSKTQE